MEELGDDVDDEEDHRGRRSRARIRRRRLGDAGADQISQIRPDLSRGKTGDGGGNEGCSQWRLAPLQAGEDGGDAKATAKAHSEAGGVRVGSRATGSGGARVRLAPPRSRKSGAQVGGEINSILSQEKKRRAVVELLLLDYVR